MGALGKSEATLRLFGDDLDPDEITRILGKSPTASERKGEIIRRTPGNERIARTGSWRLHASGRQPEDLDGQVVELLSDLTDDVNAWRSLASKYRVNLFCGLFMRGWNEGVILSSTTMVALAERGVSVELDIYAAKDPVPFEVE